ncbi:MAG: hypothetical protein QSU88_07265 [Candidatus Methanoperedens sp.]|nr:hypothetical protein [Candidatus Methanoperedens sp.]
MPNRIREETEDTIVFGESPLKILILLLISLVLIYLSIDYSGKSGGYFFLFLFFFIMLWIILHNKTVTIDKKSKTLIIKNNLLWFVEKIPFSDINGIYIEHTRYSQIDDVPDGLNLKLTTNQGKAIMIYQWTQSFIPFLGDNEDGASDFAWDLAKKIENFIPISPISTWHP